MGLHNKLQNCIIVGDININTINITSQNIVSFNDLMNEFNLINKVDKPTYISISQNPSLLDHIWSNIDLRYMAYVFNNPISDHMPVLSMFDMRNQVTFRHSTFRDYSVRNINTLLIYLEREKYELQLQLRNQDNVDVQSTTIVDWLSNLTNKYFPIKWLNRFQCSEFVNHG